EQMERDGWRIVHHPDTMQRVFDGYYAAVATGEPFEMTFPLRGADGRYREFLTRAVALRDAAGRVAQWFGTNTDISAQREAEARFRAVVETTPEFVKIVAPDGTLQYTNRAGVEMLEAENAESLTGRY